MSKASPTRAWRHLEVTTSTRWPVLFEGGHGSSAPNWGATESAAQTLREQVNCPRPAGTTATRYVVDVPAKLAARVRLFDTGHNRKTDARDAHSIAIVAVRTAVCAS